MVIHKAQFPGTTEFQEIVIPVDSRGQMLINFAGKWTTTFKHASYAEVLSTKPESTTEKGEELENKIIFRGYFQKVQNSLKCRGGGRFL